MLSNNENTALISSTPNEWPQIEVDEKISMASESRFVEKQGHHQNQEQPPQQALRCPRCDSSNTKFCYYNNYSLSQPRHFCKACKRYWTRGGTLRNVPVGGGYYRRNKRVRRPASASSVDEDSSSLSQNPNPTSQPQINISSSSNHVNPLFYGLPGSGSDINLPFSRFNSAGYDNLPPHLSALGLGFSSNPLLHNYSNIFGSSASSASDTPITISSLLGSTLNQKKNATYYQTLGSFHGLQMGSNGGETGMTAAMKAADIEDGQGRMEWNSGYQNPVEQIGLSDPTVYWNTRNVGAWHDPGNIGSSSVTSLI